jgi:hypothetical protein
MIFFFRVLSAAFGCIFLWAAGKGIRNGKLQAKADRSFDSGSVEFSQIGTPVLFWIVVPIFTILGVCLLVASVLKRRDSQTDDF